MIIATICTIPERIEDFHQVYTRILFEQSRPVDRLHVWLNGYHAIPHGLRTDDRVVFHVEPSNPGPYIRYKPTGSIGDKDVLVTLDDDVNYPIDYISSGTAELNSNMSAICYGGINWDPFVTDYAYSAFRWLFMPWDSLSSKRKVSVPGGATAFFRGSAIRGVLEYWEPYLATNDDLLIGSALAARKIPLYSCTRRRQWLRELESTHASFALYRSDGAQRKRAFQMVCNKGFDPTGGILFEISNKCRRVLVISDLSPLSEDFAPHDIHVSSLSGQEASVHLLTKVPAHSEGKVQQLVDKNFLIHPVSYQENSGRLGWFPLVRVWRGKRVAARFATDWERRLAIVLDMLQPTELYHLTKRGLETVQTT